MRFTRQEYWIGLPGPTTGHLPNTGIEPTSFISPALAGDFFTTRTTWEAPVILEPNKKSVTISTFPHLFAMK